MFLKYNGILRRFPDGVVKGLKGNTYTTTIHCIVSGIIKLSKVMRLPDSRTVYRGLGGLDLPEAFTTPDECGIRGGVENGMLSTTLDRYYYYYYYYCPMLCCNRFVVCNAHVAYLLFISLVCRISAELVDTLPRMHPTMLYAHLSNPAEYWDI